MHVLEAVTRIEQRPPDPVAASYRLMGREGRDESTRLRPASVKSKQVGGKQLLLTHTHTHTAVFWTSEILHPQHETFARIFPIAMGCGISRPASLWGTASPRPRRCPPFSWV